MLGSRAMDGYGITVRDYPPPCRHTKASTEKDLKIKALEAKIRWYEEQTRRAQEIAEQHREELELEKLKTEHQQSVIDFQYSTIKELEEVLVEQSSLVDSLFADPKAASTPALQLRAGQQIESTTDRMKQALMRRAQMAVTGRPVAAKVNYAPQDEQSGDEMSEDSFAASRNKLEAPTKKSGAAGASGAGFM